MILHQPISTGHFELDKLDPFEVFHIGGDETPGFAWTESPACDKYMNENDLKITDLFTHFIVQYAGIVNKHGFQVAGWEEAFIYRHMRPLELEKGQGSGILLNSRLVDGTSLTVRETLVQR